MLRRIIYIIPGIIGISSLCFMLSSHADSVIYPSQLMVNYQLAAESSIFNLTSPPDGYAPTLAPYGVLVNGSLRFWNILLNGEYNLNSLPLNSNNEIVNNTKNHSYKFGVFYVFKIPSSLEIALGVNGAGQQTLPEIIKNTGKYYDYNQSRLGIGIAGKIGLRPVQPLLLFAEAGFYPYITNTFSGNFTFPDKLQMTSLGAGVDINIWEGLSFRLAYNGNFIGDLNGMNYSETSHAVNTGIVYSWYPPLQPKITPTPTPVPTPSSVSTPAPTPTPPFPMPSELEPEETPTPEPRPVETPTPPIKPTFAPTPEIEPTPEISVPPDPSLSISTYRTYTVQKGDSLEGISFKMFGVKYRWQEIYKLNTNLIKKPNQLIIGSVLLISPKDTYGLQPLLSTFSAPSITKYTELRQSIQAELKKINSIKEIHQQLNDLYKQLSIASKQRLDTKTLLGINNEIIKREEMLTCLPAPFNNTNDMDALGAAINKKINALQYYLNVIQKILVLYDQLDKITALKANPKEIEKIITEISNLEKQLSGIK